MADIELSYKGSVIGSLTGSGSLTMQTSGKYCEDDITLDYIAPGGGVLPKMVCAIYGTNTGTSFVNVGTGALTNVFADPEFCTYSNGVFTFLKPGTYTIYYSGRGGYNTNGDAVYMHYRIYQNSNTLVSVTSNTVANGGVVNTISNVSISVNDTIYAQTKNNTGNNTRDFSMFIVKES